MAMTPDVTVVIPVYNEEKHLRACLKSVVRQTFAGMEIICIDDASRDRSCAHLTEAMKGDARIRVIRNEINLGAAAARNLGIRAAQGRFIRFVDADDLLPERSTEILHRRALETGSDVVRGSIALFGGFGVPRKGSSANVPDRRTASLMAEPSLWIPWWHTSYLISTDLIRTGDLSYPQLRRGEDPVFIAGVLTRARQISLLPDIVYRYRRYRKNSGSGASNFDAVTDYLHHAALVKDMFRTYHPECWDRGYGPFIVKDFRELVLRCRLNAAQMDFVASETKKIWGEDILSDLTARRSGPAEILSRWQAWWPRQGY